MTDFVYSRHDDSLLISFNPIGSNLKVESFLNLCQHQLKMLIIDLNTFIKLSFPPGKSASSSTFWILLLLQVTLS